MSIARTRLQNTSMKLGNSTMTHDPYAVTPRRPLTAKQRLKLFVEHDGKCCVCGSKIGINEKWIDEHKLALWLGGSNDIENRAPAHVSCAREKTDKEATNRAKGRSVAEKHFGAQKSKRPMMGSRLSKYKRKMDGSVVRR